MKLSTKIILPIILISALLILLNGCSGTVPDDSPGYTPGSITGRIMVPSQCADCLTDGPCLPKGISDFIPTHWVSAEEAIVTIIPHATLTDEDGYYTLTNVEPGVYYVITATYKNLVLKDVVEPDGVEAGKLYDAGTANCESTALGLYVEYLWDMGMDADEIELLVERYIETDKFAELVNTVCCIIEDCDNITNYCCLVECDDPGYTPELESITVNTGSMNLCFLESDSITPLVSVIAHYTEGEPSKIVTSSASISYSSNNPSIASFSGTTVTAGESEDTTSINVSVTYTEGGVTVDSTGTVPVTVIDCAVTTTYDLTMIVLPVGTGTTIPSVGGSPYNYAEGTVVTISATPVSGYHFVDWTGDVTGSTNPTTVTMNANKTVTANFEENADVTINYVATTGGSVDPTSETLAPATGSAAGSTATEDSGYDFVNWTDSGSNEVSTNLHFTPAKVAGLNVAATYTANFRKIPCVYLSYTSEARCHDDWAFVNVEDVKNLHKAVITLEQSCSQRVLPVQYSVGALMSPGVCIHTTSDFAQTIRRINLTVTKNNGWVDGDVNIVGVYFSADGDRPAKVTIISSTLYNENDNVINHTIDTTPLELDL